MDCQNATVFDIRLVQEVLVSVVLVQEVRVSLAMGASPSRRIQGAAAANASTATKTSNQEQSTGDASREYIAVRKGKSVSACIFLSWNEACREQLEGFEGAEYAKFQSFLQAERYLRIETSEEAKTIADASYFTECLAALPSLRPPCFPPPPPRVAEHTSIGVQVDADIVEEPTITGTGAKTNSTTNNNSRTSSSQGGAVASYKRKDPPSTLNSTVSATTTTTTSTSTATNPQGTTSKPAATNASASTAASAPVGNGKRKRGRPRKETTTTTTSSPEDPPPIKRKRGRPPKGGVPTTTATSTRRPAPKPRKRPQGVVTEPLEQAPSTLWWELYLTLTQYKKRFESSLELETLKVFELLLEKKRTRTLSHGMLLKWSRVQRDSYKLFSEEQRMANIKVQRLTFLGFDWDKPSIAEELEQEEDEVCVVEAPPAPPGVNPPILPARERPSRKIHSKWEASLQMLVAYKEAHGTFDVPSTIGNEEDRKLRKWVDDQRLLYRKLKEGKQATKNATMTEEKIALFESVGFHLDLDTKKKRQRKPGKQWELMIQRLKQHYETTKSFEIEVRTAEIEENDDDAAKATKELRKWVVEQEAQYRLFRDDKPSTFSDEKIRRLQAINYKFEDVTKTGSPASLMYL
jgi:hypothetical protein